MVGTIAQLVTLVSHGNKALADGKSDPDFLNNTMFEICREVSFIELFTDKKTGKSMGYKVAKDPNDWFEKLINEDCIKLRLFYLPPKSDDKMSLPPYMTAGFIGGGGKWLLEEVYEDKSVYWTNKWKMGDRNAPDRKIWHVYYAKVVFDNRFNNPKIDLHKTKARFNALLDDLSAFSKSEDMDRFIAIFEKAKKALNSSVPNEDYYHKSLLADNDYILEAHQLIYAAGMAWVFGGMGSWNDMGFSDPDTQSRYVELSNSLYDIIKTAILASVNSI